MPSDTHARCEPPEALRKVDGWHWVQQRDYAPVCAFWNARNGCWFHLNAMGAPHHAAHYGYRYLSPVPSPAEIAALVRAGRAVVQFVAHYPELKTPATDALSAALDAPSLREIGDE